MVADARGVGVSGMPTSEIFALNMDRGQKTWKFADVLNDGPLIDKSLGAVHKGRPQIFPYFWPLPPSCLQPSAFQGPLPKKDVCKSGIWPPLHFRLNLKKV